MAQFRAHQRFQKGLSYAEVLIATVLIAASLVPALEALQTGIQGADVHETRAVEHYHLTIKMEEVLAEPFSVLNAAAGTPGSTTPSIYSDSPGIARRRLVFISPYDGDNADADNDPFTGTDIDLLWVRTEIEGTPHAMQTLTSR